MKSDDELHHATEINKDVTMRVPTFQQGLNVEQIVLHSMKPWHGRENRHDKLA